jgi:hypothetical protein
MSCRVARLSRDHTQLDLGSCCRCGSANLEVCYTSKALGPHLCPPCAQSPVERGTVNLNTVTAQGRQTLPCAGTPNEALF